MAEKKNGPKPEKDEKFILVHLGKSNEGVSVINSVGFASAVKLNEFVQELSKDQSAS